MPGNAVSCAADALLMLIGKVIDGFVEVSNLVPGPLCLGLRVSSSVAMIESIFEDAAAK